MNTINHIAQLRNNNPAHVAGFYSVQSAEFKVLSLRALLYCHPRLDPGSRYIKKVYIHRNYNFGTYYKHTTRPWNIQAPVPAYAGMTTTTPSAARPPLRLRRGITAL